MVEVYKPRIIRDTREKRGVWRFPNVVDKCLKTGDYSIEGLEDKLIIERKRTTGEIARNVLEPRFRSELARLNEIPHAYIILEFDFDTLYEFPKRSTIPFSKWKYLRINGKFLVKKVLQLQEDFPNVTWIFCKDSKEAEVRAYSILNEHSR